MRRSVDDVRKRIAKRKQQQKQMTAKANKSSFLLSDEEKHGIPRFYDYEYNPDDDQPLFKKERFIFQIFSAFILFLLVGIMFNNSTNKFDQAKNVVYDIFDKEFQFATVSKWYEDQFGQPLALFPSEAKKVETVDKTKDNETQPVSKDAFALPVTGEVLETFKISGQGIKIKTEKKAKVEAVEEGFVIYTGAKEGFGKTVVVQHPDQSETWYGNLNEIDVKLFQFVEKSAALGSVVSQDTEENGTLFFAVKKDDTFIDPMQVIPFE